MAVDVDRLVGAYESIQTEPTELGAWASLERHPFGPDIIGSKPLHMGVGGARTRNVSPAQGTDLR